MFPFHSPYWIVTDGQPHPDFENCIKCTCSACSRSFALLVEDLHPDVEKNWVSCPNETCRNAGFLRLISAKKAPAKRRPALKIIYSSPVRG